MVVVVATGLLTWQEPEGPPGPRRTAGIQHRVQTSAAGGPSHGVVRSFDIILSLWLVIRKRFFFTRDTNVTVTYSTRKKWEFDSRKENPSSEVGTDEINGDFTLEGRASLIIFHLLIILRNQYII